MSPAARARRLRRRQTDAEAALWTRLRDRQCMGLKFRRQHPLGRYIVDFFCIERGLVVELDGGQHASPAHRESDRQRDEWLARHGHRVLRIWTHHVREDMEAVLTQISQAARQDRAAPERPPLTRSVPCGAEPPSPQGEG